MSAAPLVFRCDACGGINRVDAARIATARCGRCQQHLRTDGHAHHVSDDELAALVRSSPVPVLVDFWAEWCQPCQVLGPILEDLGQRHTGRLIVAKVDTEAHQRTAAELGVQGIPAVFLYRDGKIVDKATGLRPLPAWEALVAPWI
jgi:thioredoxin 2